MSDWSEDKNLRWEKDPYVQKYLCCSFCGNKELEIEGMSINWGVAEQVVVYECHGIILCYKKRLPGRLQKNLERLT